MRYALLVHLVHMSRTLIEAAEYLATSPSAEMQAELSGNGEMMLAQMRETLLQHEPSLKSDKPLRWIDDISALWKDGRGTGRTLLDALAAFAQALPEEVNYKVRALFVAELGEKWDSLASVYACMRDDPRFDPIVVMEPVFRRVKWGDEVKQDTIYKDYLTPLGIPFLDYNRYSIQEDRPDLALICQPYESVTLPQFWPENIAKYTRLVYLPYYFTGVVQEDQIDSMCRMPVFHHAWKVIGASEKHKNFYSKYAPNGGRNMIVTGLPKLDGLATLRERGVPYPAGWEEKLKGKTVFLANTWYSIFEATLDRLNSYIQTVETDDLKLAFIWRPHPMTETVTKLYNPGLYARYQECKKQFRNGINTVLDEEASFEAAFYYSDAMISGASSMTHQYLLMDKPLYFLGDNTCIAMLLENSWMEFYNDPRSADFIQRICKGEDRNAKLRKKILKRDLPLADGKSGKRVCAVLWKAMHEEDGIGCNDSKQ